MKTTTNIIFLTDCFSDITAGAEKQILELAKRLDHSKYKLIIVSLDHCGPTVAPLIASIGCRLEVFRVRRIYGLSGLIQGIRLLKFIKTEKIDVMQTYHFGSDIWGTVIARIAGVKTIISNRRDMGFWRSAHHVMAYQMVKRWVKKIVVNARSIKDLVLISEGVPATHIEVIYNGVELSKNTGTTASELRQSLNLPAQALVLMHVANLKPVKGHIFLLKALQTILKHHPQVYLVLVGEDMLNGELQKNAASLGIDQHVRFLGKRKDVGTLLTIADIGVLPSLSEGMSNAILEYMTAGKPVVTTKVGGSPELVEDGVNGFLVEKENSQQLEGALITLIKDENLRKTMGDHGRQKAIAHFSMEGMVNHYIQLYSTLAPPKIKILHFISSGGLFGAENVLLNIAKHFNNDHYTSIVGAIEDNRSPKTEVIEKAKSLGLPVKIFQSSGRFDFQTINDLRKFLNRNQIDILHTHNYKSNIIGTLAAALLKIKKISTAHGFTRMDTKVSSYEHIDRWFLKKCFHKVVMVTGTVFTGNANDKRTVIQNGIDVAKFSLSRQSRDEIRNRYRIGPDEILIGTIGRLSIEKNQKLLIESVKELCKNRSNVRIMIVGDGALADELKAYVAECGLDLRIIFTGLISDVTPFYQAFDIFTLTSLTEGIPLTVLEAMSSGVPVVSTAVGGVPDIIKHQATGWLVKSRDAAGLRAGFETLMDDPTMRQSMATAARDFVCQEYSVDNMNHLYNRVYQEVIT